MHAGREHIPQDMCPAEKGGSIILFGVAERMILLAAGDGRSSSASLRIDAYASSKITTDDFVELSEFIH